MPAPPPKVFGTSAEEDFDWIKERMDHALELFRPGSSLGLSVKREVDYEVIPPTKKGANFQARVTISTRTIYRHDTPQSDAQKRRLEAKKEAAKIKLDNPFGLPGEGTGSEGGPLPDVPLAELENPDIVDPRVPLQELVEKKEYLLEYVDGEWKLKSEGLAENEQMWFDYALQQGEFALGAAGEP